MDLPRYVDGKINGQDQAANLHPVWRCRSQLDTHEESGVVPSFLGLNAIGK